MSPFRFSRFMDFDGPNLFVPHECAVCFFERGRYPSGGNDLVHTLGTLAHSEPLLRLFPGLGEIFPQTSEELFGALLREMCRLGRGLPLAPPAVLLREDHVIVAVEHFPGLDVRPFADLAAEWLTSLAEGTAFPGEEQLQHTLAHVSDSGICTPFSLSLFAEAKKRRIPFRRLHPEDAFLLGYGSRQLRLAGEHFSTDIVPDLALLSRPDRLAAFAAECGFPSASQTTSPEGTEETVLHMILAGGACVAARMGKTDVLSLVHMDNILLAEALGSFFGSTPLVLDCIARNPGISWKEGPFAVAKAHPGVGNVPPEAAGAILEHLCPQGDTFGGNGKGTRRIPLIAGNRFSPTFRALLLSELRGIRESVSCPSAAAQHLGFASPEGFFLDGQPLCRPRTAGDALRLLLRHPSVDLGLMEHRSEHILQEGFVHEGADVVILESPSAEEKVLERDVLSGGYLVDVLEDEILVYKGEEHVDTMTLRFPEEKDEMLIEALRPLLEERLALYTPEASR